MAMQTALVREDFLTYSYILGRIARTVLIIDPLPLDAFEDEIGAGTYDFDADALKEEIDEAMGNKRLGAPPDYLPVEEMNVFYMALFWVEGFG